MAGDESTQQWLGRNRPPRVQITYDLETRGAIEKKELPLVVGIIADLGGEVEGETVADMKKRKFIEIDRDNFNDVMKSIAPKYKLKSGETITFETVDDFSPDQLVKEKVKALQDLLAIRNRLNELLQRVDGNDAMDAQLIEVAKDANKRTALKGLVGGTTGNAGTGNAGTGNAGTGNAGTGDAGTGNSGTGDAGTGNAGTGDSGTGNAGTGEGNK